MEDIKIEIDNTLNSLYKDFTAIKSKYPKPQKLSRFEYIWLVFSCNIYFQAKDLLVLTKDHEGKTERIKTSIYAIFRSILEDYFYLKLLVSEKEKIDIHLNALIASSQINNRKNLQSLLNLEKIGKYIPTPAIEQITSIEGMKGKIAEYEGFITPIRDAKGETN
ncbi:hypothetical protein COU49_02490 [Candidatus Nomurabacteria bacterium CG10_big_fil_rev_8_21_14_0_10_35_16]|uniref:Uncharacterized protein n=1 Tax=Candidatus Nomurabacteria bacterium CG10_big_fil_rev_8_21_14_0_10_35_16 TaxID=1974731 RepID=A0A2H0TAZ0_9BACT|nr:MAG: hypothetical protein COU49_02490 [Candidatus Nomurabacteria bacterium CG10_big_fil_rev_8_21_14_0_10_35_16]